MKEFILTTHADHNPLVTALRDDGVDVRRVNWKQPLPDLMGCMAFYGNLFDEIKDWAGLAKLKAQLRQHNVPYVFWNRDAPWNTGMKLMNRLAMQWLKPVDIYLAHSMQNCEWFGGEEHYFPNAAQPDYYLDTDLRQLRDESRYRYDVAFFGSFGNSKDYNAIKRHRFLTALENCLKRSIPEIRFEVIDTSRQPLSFVEQLAFIRASKISINIGAMCDLPSSPSWGLAERVFGIPAAGGLVISDARKHLAESSLQDIIPTFDSPQSCAVLIGSLLKDWVVLRNLADAQHDAIIARHTYRLRARELVRILNEYRFSMKVRA